MPLRDWLAITAKHLAAGDPIASVTCVSVRGSAPCAVGSRLLVDDTRIWGTIGGGNLEFLATKQARKLIASCERSLLQDLPLGPMLAQCCGGRVQLLIEKFLPNDLPLVLIARDNPAKLVTCCEPMRYGKWLVSSDGTCLAQIGKQALPLESFMPGRFDGTYWCEQTHTDLRKVFIFGGGHVGSALAHILEPVRCRRFIVDPRSEVRAQLEDRLEVFQTDQWSGIAASWEKGSAAIVLTHSHELDYKWVRAILKEGNSAFCGLIGSKTKRARFVRRLKKDGLSDHEIAHLTSPIGLPGSKSKDPGCVALSTAAQLLPLFEPQVGDSFETDIVQETRCSLQTKTLS